MIEPVELKDFFTTFFSGAMVILFGALYALLFAWAKLRGKTLFMVGAYIAYALLFAATISLASATHLHDTWSILVGMMLIGYFLAPHGIWHLCVGTHREHNAHPSTSLPTKQTVTEESP